MQEQLVDLQNLKNKTGVTLEVHAQEKATQIIAEGQRDAVSIEEQTRNQILDRKVKILKDSEKAGQVVLFIQQQLPHLFDAFREHAKGLNVDSLVIMDDESGFNGAVNRGPAAFGDFLRHFYNALGIDVKSFVSEKEAGQ